MNEPSATRPRSLQDQTEFLRQIIDMNPSLIFVKDREGRFVLVNRAVAEVYGTTVEELIGKRDADFNVHADEVEHFRKDDLEVMDTLQEKFVSEEVLTGPSGEVRYLQTIKRPLVDEDGVARHVLGVATDVTRLRLAEAEKRDLQTQVFHAQKLESLGVLAGGIAHDFNNLLMGIMGYADLARMEIPRESGVQETIKQIQLASRRAADLCRQLLDYSGKGRFVNEPVNLSRVVEEITDLLKLSVFKNASLEFDLADPLPDVGGDPIQIRQIVMNLITNAADAIGQRDGVISVSTGTMQCSSKCVQTMSVGEELEPGRYVFLQVTDDGKGMDPDTRQRIFDPFFTTKVTGRGLGMAAVLGIVRGHHGGIMVSSRPGHGTTVKVLFPLQGEAGGAEPPAEGPPAPLTARGTILVVDDEEVVRSVARKILERAGSTVLTASDGEEAIRIFEENRDEIDGVLLDLTMPRMEGEEVFRSIQEIRKVPVILMSGFSESEAGDRLGGGSPAGFLTKPFGASEVVGAVRRLLETK